jgi:hypothetical protein
MDHLPGFSPEDLNDLGCFTNEQVSMIVSIIDRRLETIGIKTLPHHAPVEKNYHSLAEIRSVIRKNFPEIRDRLGGEEVPIAVLRHEVGRHVTFRPGDRETIGSGRDRVPRWEQQFGSAIHPESWAGCPFVPVARRGYYRIKQVIV